MFNIFITIICDRNKFAGGFCEGWQPGTHTIISELQESGQSAPRRGHHGSHWNPVRPEHHPGPAGVRKGASPQRSAARGSEMPRPSWVSAAGLVCWEKPLNVRVLLDPFVCVTPPPAVSLSVCESGHQPSPAFGARDSDGNVHLRLSWAPGLLTARPGASRRPWLCGPVLYFTHTRAHTRIDIYIYTYKNCSFREVGRLGDLLVLFLWKTQTNATSALQRFHGNSF